MIDFQRNLSEWFHERLSSNVITMPERKKIKYFETINPLNADLIFLCVIYYLSMDQLDFFFLLNYELAPVPTSTKSLFKNNLKVEVLSQTLKHDVLVFDGGGVLHSSV